MNEYGLPAVRGKYRFDAALGEMTWFQVGGKAQVLFRPEDVEDLAHFMAHKPDDMPLVTLGVGSNIIIRDEGFAGIVIKLGRNFNYINKLSNNALEVGCATLDVHVASFAQQAGIGGLEFLSGIPGTIGGALAMNAGAYGGDIKSCLVAAQAITMHGEIIEFNNADMELSYRHNASAKDLIFTSAKLQGYADEPAIIQAKIADIHERRNASQPVRSKTGGSTFRNPPDQQAWRLIDAAGCRGLRVGDAMVSEQHTNFLINTGNATAADLLSLIDLVKKRVFETSGVLLQEEIKVIG